MALESLHRFCLALRRGLPIIGASSDIVDDCTRGLSPTLSEAIALFLILSGLRRVSDERAFQLATHREGELSVEDLTLGVLPMFDHLFGLHSEAETLLASRSKGTVRVRAIPRDEQGGAFDSGARRLTAVDAYARCQGVPHGIVDRMYASIDHEMRGFGVPVKCNPVFPERGGEPLVSCTIVLHSDRLPISFTSHGRIKRPAEDVGRAVAKRAKRFLKSGCDLPYEYLPVMLVAYAAIRCATGITPPPYTVDRTPGEVSGCVQQLFGDWILHSVSARNQHSSQLSFR